MATIKMSRRELVSLIKEQLNEAGPVDSDRNMGQFRGDKAAFQAAANDFRGVATAYFEEHLDEFVTYLLDHVADESFPDTTTPAFVKAVVDGVVPVAGSAVTTAVKLAFDQTYGT